jgi:hypothetical protein
VGASLSATGSTTVGTTSSTAYSGHAVNSCGSGPEATAVVNIQNGATASLTTSASSVQVNDVATLTATISNASSWSIASFLGNGLVPSSGTSNGTFTINYAAFHGGSDTLTLTANGPCGGFQRNAAIFVGSPQPTPTPTPTPSGYLRCCDGTLSPTCTSCANRQGCCSHHGGVCGC